MIKAKDRRLHLINIAVLSLLNPGPTLEGVQQVELPFQYTAEEDVVPSRPTIKEEEEVVQVSDFEVFNQPQSPEVPTGGFSLLPPAQVIHFQETSTVPDTMVLQHKIRSSLRDILES